MKFLCLPGAYGSAKNFKVQLGPLAEEIERRGLATFVYSQGAYEVDPPTGWEDYFGQRPLYRFLEDPVGVKADNNNIAKLRHVPRGLSPEDTLRMCEQAFTADDWNHECWNDCIERIFNTIDADPEIDAIIGYSEGAMIASSLILEEGLRCQRTGAPRRIKFGFFISGAPPFQVKGSERAVALLADEAGCTIDIPSFHLFGCDDPFLVSAISLFNACDQTTASMYDHGLGHIVPRDADNVKQLGDLLEQILPRVEEQFRRGEAVRLSTFVLRAESETEEEEELAGEDEGERMGQKEVKEMQTSVQVDELQISRVRGAGKRFSRSAKGFLEVFPKIVRLDKAKTYPAKKATKSMPWHRGLKRWRQNDSVQC